MKITLKLLIGIICLSFSNASYSQKTYINKDWESTSGTIGNIERSASVIDSNGDIITVSNTLGTSGVDTDVLVEKHDGQGSLLWSQTYNGAGNGDDYGVQIAVNSTDQVIVAASVYAGQNDMDIAILKYAPSGSLLHSSSWGGSSSLNDIPADLHVDNAGDIYLAGGTEASNGFSDYVVLKFNSFCVYQWAQTYDYNNLHDAATELSDDGSNLAVVGASASSTVNWDYATLLLSKTNGSVISTQRTSMTGAGLDQALAVTSDASNNIYVTGYVETGGDKNVRTLKFDSNLSLVWSVNFATGHDDIGNAIDVDDNGNIYVSGLTESAQGHISFLTVKYNSSGVEQWNRKYGESDYSASVGAKHAVVINNEKILVAGTVDQSGQEKLAVVCYSLAGNILFTKVYEDLSQEHELEDLTVDGDSFYLTGTASQGGTSSTKVVKYSYREKPNILATDNGKDFAQGQIIVRFQSEVINQSLINNTDKHFAQLSDFVSSGAISAMNNKTGLDWGKMNTYKIFRRLTAQASTSMTRTGELVEFPDYWATLLIELDDPSTIDMAIDSLNEVSPYVLFAEKDYLAKPASVPNDPFYSTNQLGFFQNSTFTDADVDIEGAWSYEVGRDHTKVGIFDNDIYVTHPEFGDGTVDGSKIKGWNYVFDQEIGLNLAGLTTSHGTAVAGIIGADRNNQVGVAGIAAGDIDNQNEGVEIYEMTVYELYFAPNGAIDKNFASASDRSAAIIEGALDITLPILSYGFGLNVQNHSYRSDGFSQLVESAVETCFNQGCTFVTSRGNEGNDDLRFPACYNDLHVISVIASGQLGLRATSPLAAFNSSFGQQADFMAPGDADLVSSTASPDFPYSFSTFSDSNYTQFSGTSAAAPIVSGVAALMHSLHHPNLGAPNQLVHQDIENIIQTTAADRGVAGYDNETGWGLIDAKEALRQVNYPSFYVHHLGQGVVPTITPMTNNNVSISVLSNTHGLAAGLYAAKKHEVSWNYVKVFPPGHNIIDSWVLESSTRYGVSQTNPVTGNDYRVVTGSIGTNSASLSVTTYAWYIDYILQTNQQVHEWFPMNPTSLQNVWSLHVENTALTSLEEEEANSIALRPNPAQQQINISFDNLSGKSAALEIVDISGKKIAVQILDNLKQGENNVVIDLSALSNGIYFCTIRQDDKVISEKFIKQ